MKFNPQLRTQLEALQKCVENDQTPIQNDQPPIPKYPYKPREIVAGGDIIWKPVDRQASMLLAKAPWWAKPINNIMTNQTLKEFDKGNKKPRENIANIDLDKPEALSGVLDHSIVLLKENQFLRDRLTAYEALQKKCETINGELVLDELNPLKPSVESTEALVARCKKAIEELFTQLDSIKLAREDLKAQLKMFVEDFSETRMSVVGLTSQMVTPLKDIRQFFLGANYDSEVKRLQEFVSLCERLKALKDSGFLDAISDTLLRLAIK